MKDDILPDVCAEEAVDRFAHMQGGQRADPEEDIALPAPAHEPLKDMVRHGQAFHPQRVAPPALLVRHGQGHEGKADKDEHPPQVEQGNEQEQEEREHGHGEGFAVLILHPQR